MSIAIIEDMLVRPSSWLFDDSFQLVDNHLKKAQSRKVCPSIVKEERKTVCIRDGEGEVA